MSELLAVGYAVIDRIDDQDHLGGAAAGIAANGRGLGLGTGLLSIFGEDGQSQNYHAYLTELGVDMSHSHTIPGATIPTNEISHADRTKGWQNDGVTEHMTTLPVSNTIDSYEAVHLASPHFALAKAVAKRRQSGLLTYSPGPKLSLNDAYLDRDTLGRSEIVFMSDVEWKVAQRILNLDHPADLTDHGPRIAVTTHGEDGARISYKDNGRPMQEHISARNINQPETTGAGDALALGFIAAYMNRMPLRTCGEIGSTLAYCALGRSGVMIDPTNLQQFAQVAKDNYGLELR